MLEALVLLAVGFAAGRLWAWIKTGTQVPECPRCAISDEGQRMALHISAQARTAEEQMRETATQYQRPEASRPYGTHDPSNGGEWR